MEAGLFDKSMAKNSTLMSIGDDEESSQSILDNHVAGIWSNTPSQSSGHVSPKSPDRVALTRSKAIQQFQHSETMPADSAANMTFPPRVCSQQKEPCLSKSFDGSVGTERVTRHIHLHHHHHHRDISSKQRSNCTDPSAGVYRRSDDATYEHGRVRSNSRRAAPVWKGSGANSSVESGICVMFKADSSSWNNPTNEKYVYSHHWTHVTSAVFAVDLVWLLPLEFLPYGKTWRFMHWHSDDTGLAGSVEFGLLWHQVGK